MPPFIFRDFITHSVAYVQATPGARAVLVVTALIVGVELSLLVARICARRTARQADRLAPVLADAEQEAIHTAVRKGAA